MAIIRKRNRLVYFRVSELEFDRFNDLCQRVGACNLSELARCALHRMLDDHSLEELSVDLQALQDQVTAVDGKLQQLVAILRKYSVLRDEAEAEGESPCAAAAV
jgi:ABC-type phosphate transport system auxiliary subunit